MTDDDWPRLLEWNNDPEVLYYAEEDDIASYTLEQIQELYGSVCEHALCFIIEADEQPIGECWLQRMNLDRVLHMYPDLDCRRIDLTIGAKAYWGQGIGTRVIHLLAEYGFCREGVDVIYEPGIADYNVRSLRAFQKVGFKVSLQTKTEPGHKAASLYDLVLTREAFLETRRAG
jgi:RimJ/RimL family protein N-acetyltransferase